MQVFVAQVINGVSLGSIYVLLVTGFNLLLLVAMIIHFSYPQVVVLSMYITWMALRATGNNLVVGIIAGVASSVVINLVSAPLFQRVAWKRGLVDINGTMVLSLGIGMIITDLLSRVLNQGLPIAFPETLSSSAALVNVGFINIKIGQILSLAVGILAVSAFFLLLYRTRPGRAFRAIAEDPGGARLVGIPLIRTGLFSYFLSGVLGGIIAVLLATLIGFADAGLGERVALKVLAVSIIAGLGNLAGGLVVGLLLGILEAIVQGYVSGSWSNAIAFVLMLVVMLTKPKGLFGARV